MHLFLRPHLDDLPGVLLAEAVFEPIILFDVLVASLELIQRGLEDFNGTFGRDSGAILKSIRAQMAITHHNNDIITTMTSLQKQG